MSILITLLKVIKQSFLVANSVLEASGTQIRYKAQAFTTERNQKHNDVPDFYIAIYI
jgi:hypothetical protein